MAKYKSYDYAQTVMVAVSLDEQLEPGTLEHTIHYVVEKRLDLSGFDQERRNDETGRPGYDPRVLLKVVLLGYSRGKLSSRKLEAACKENIIFMALSCGQRPDHSTIAEFVSGMKAKIDTPAGRALYSRRLGIVEPVFGHIGAHKGMNRSTLRGTAKVNVQWKLYCLVHNLEKIGRYALTRN